MTKARKAKISRDTSETQITVDLNVDGSGKYNIDTPVPFFNHMLEAFTKHGLFDLKVKADGDVHIDDHHLVEDVGLVLGQAFSKAIGDKKGIKRYGHFSLPMDETLVNVAVDLCNRPYFVYNSPVKTGKIKKFDIELVYEFFQAFAAEAKINLHINVNYGRNKHHIVEATFKCFSKAMDMATQVDPRVKSILSTKGKL